jgi:hypothetical protein
LRFSGIYPHIGKELSYGNDEAQMPKRQRVIKAARIALIGTGLTFFVSLAMGIAVFRGNDNERAPRHARPVPAPASDRRNVPKCEETDNRTRSALIGAGGVILASLLSGLLAFGGTILGAYVSSAASPPSSPAPYYHGSHHSNRWGFPCRDDDQRQLALLRPRPGGAVGSWPAHFSCPEVPQRAPGARATHRGDVGYVMGRGTTTA